MLREETSSFTDEEVPSDASDMKNPASNNKNRRRLTNPVELRMVSVPGARLVRLVVGPKPAEADSLERRLVAELQQGGPATDMGRARWKVRLAFAPAKPMMIASKVCLQS
jgi:hypothetical protein